MKSTRPLLLIALLTCLHGALQCPAQPAYVLDSDFPPSVLSPSDRILLPQPGGKILVHGWINERNHAEGLVRLSQDGTLDPGFAPLFTNAFKVTLGPDGKLFVIPDPPWSQQSSVIHLNADGSTNVPRSVPLPNWAVLELEVEPVSGDFLLSGPRGEFQRIGSDGSIKASFGPLSGWKLGSSHLVALESPGFGSVVLQATATGSAGVGGPFPPGLILRGSDGNILRTFPVARVEVRPLVVEDGEKILVAGDGTLRRFFLTGMPDTGFDPSFSGTVRDVAAAEHGRVFVLGDFDMVNGERRRGVAILNPDGSLNAPFDPAERGEFDVRKLAVGTDGNLFAWGYPPGTVSGEPSLARFLALPVWRASARDASARFTGIIGCLTGWKYRVEASADLQQWDTVTTGTSTGESVPFTDTAPPGTERRFYRVMEE